MENQNANQNAAPAEFDALKFIDEIYRVLAAVTVSGVDNIRRMNIAFNGLSTLYAREEEKKRQENQEI